MPTLKQITCSIELGPSNTKLKEYHHRYTDGGVEAFIAVPEADIPFQVHITSNGYIAPGLAAYLFIDGQYQCNRNRQRLQTPCPGMSQREYEIDFKLRQREEKTSEGQFVARDWTFSKLQTANADVAPDINPNFTKNVGTIEVVILRCKNGGAAPSTEELTDSADAPASAHQPTYAAKSPSVRKAQTAPPAKAPSKAPSRAASKVSTKKASEAGSGMLGGMFGLFDGAGDRPDYGAYTPRYPREAQPPPGYQGYRDDRYEPRSYTVHGGRDYGAPAGQELHIAYDPRPRTSADHYPPASPMRGYDFHRGYRDPGHRQPMPSPMPPPVPQPMPMDRTFYPQVQPPRVQYAATPEGFHFIRELCQQMDELMRLQYEERQKYNDLQLEAHQNRHDAEFHLAAVKAARAKEQVLATLQEECQALWASLITRMNRMDEAGWNFVRDYVVLERRLVPMSHPQLQQWRDPRMLQSTGPSPAMQSAQASGAVDDRWQEMGQGQAQGGLWERKQQQYRKTPSNAQGAQDNNQNNGDWGATPDAGNQQANDDWGNNQANDQGNGNDGWGNSGQSNNGGKSNRSKSNNGGGGDWGGDGGDNNGGGGGWGDDNGSKRSQSNRGQSQNQEWGGGDNNNGGGGGDNWGGDNNVGGGGGGWGGGGGDDNKSRTAQSKVKTWNDGGAGSKAASKRPSKKNDTSTILEPVIKSYWAEWDKPDSSTGKLRAKPREPYEYPALPPPIAASGKASSVNYGVQAGRGANYAHQTYQPEYLDTMQKPYAIFTFKYRSKAALEKILKRKLDVTDVQRAIQEAEKDKLMKMPKDELVSNMMKMKLKGGSGGGGKAPAKQASKAPSGNGWGNGKPASKSGGKKNDNWGGDNAGGWDGGNDEVKPNDSASQWGGGNDNNNEGGWGNNDQGGGGGDGWGGGDAGKSKAGGGGNDWGNNGGGGGGDWGNNGGDGGGDWDKKSKTEEHFAGDPGLKQTGGDQKPSNSWANAGW